MKSGFHVVRAGPERTGCGAGGADVTEVRYPMLAARAASIKLTGNTWLMSAAVTSGVFRACTTPGPGTRD
jgi:hypothetical protein